MKPAPLHVLMTTDAVGGVWVYATTLAQELCRRGYSITLVTLGPPPDADKLTALGDVPNLRVEITDLALEWMDPAGCDSAHACAVLARIERSMRPDLVHLNSYREACAAWRSPVVVTAHSCVRSWWRACRGEEPRESRWHRYTANVGAGLLAPDLWVAPTGAFRDVIQALYGPPDAGRTVWNGIEAPPPRGKKRACIMAAGRLWDEAKNLSLLTSIAAKLPWPVRVAGSLRSHDGTIAHLDCVEWLGELPRPELLGQLQQTGIFVSPALYEPFGLTVLEAAAAGCALVLSNIPTFRELWDGAAVFVDPHDAEALRVAIDALCRNSSHRKHLQRAAVRRARRYSLSAMADAYESIYGAVAGASVRTPEHRIAPSMGELR